MSIDENKTVWQNICDTLTKRGFDVFPPATHVAECKKPYIVVKQSGAAKKAGYSTETVYYRFLVYVPKNQYSRLDEIVRDVKNILDTELYPMLMPTGQTEVDYYDDNYNAHMRAFLYRNNVRNKHL